MKKALFRYDPKTCKYEPWKLTARVVQSRLLIFISLSFLIAIGFYIAFTKKFESLDEQLLKRENAILKTEWQILEDRINKSYAELHVLIAKDDKNYRVILDTEPLAPEVREGGIGGSERFDDDEIKDMPQLITDYHNMNKLASKLEVEVQSYKELNSLLNERITMWASRPAIQPISNAQLDQLHMSYGARMHPIYKVLKEHNGLDFTAPKGTPVYATGDGQVTMAYRSESYGNVIYINHGHGYETRYAHLSKFAVRPGDKIKRGHVVGYVGSTGTSVSAHLHYEVLFNDRHVNPINFFQRDLSNEEYERLIMLGTTKNKALD